MAALSLINRQVSLLRGKRGDVSAVRRHRAVVTAATRRRTCFTDVEEEEKEEKSEYVENDEELDERKAVGELVGWCVSRGAAGSGLSVLLPDESGRGRGLEASRVLEVRCAYDPHLPFIHVSSFLEGFG